MSCHPSFSRRAPLTAHNLAKHQAANAPLAHLALAAFVDSQQFLLSQRPLVSGASAVLPAPCRPQPPSPAFCSSPSRGFRAPVLELDSQSDSVPLEPRLRRGTALPAVQSGKNCKRTSHSMGPALGTRANKNHSQTPTAKLPARQPSSPSVVACDQALKRRRESWRQKKVKKHPPASSQGAPNPESSRRALQSRAKAGSKRLPVLQKSIQSLPQAGSSKSVNAHARLTLKPKIKPGLFKNRVSGDSVQHARSRSRWADLEFHQLEFLDKKPKAPRRLSSASQPETACPFEPSSRTLRSEKWPSTSEVLRDEVRKPRRRRLKAVPQVQTTLALHSGAKQTTSPDARSLTNWSGNLRQSGGSHQLISTRPSPENLVPRSGTTDLHSANSLRLRALRRARELSRSKTLTKNSSPAAKDMSSLANTRRAHVSHPAVVDTVDYPDGEVLEGSSQGLVETRQLVEPWGSEKCPRRQADLDRFQTVERHNLGHEFAGRAAIDCPGGRLANMGRQPLVESFNDSIPREEVQTYADSLSVTEVENEPWYEENSTWGLTDVRADSTIGTPFLAKPTTPVQQQDDSSWMSSEAYSQVFGSESLEHSCAQDLSSSSLAHQIPHAHHFSWEEAGSTGSSDVNSVEDQLCMLDEIIQACESV